MLKVVGQSVPLLCVLLAMYILIIVGGPYFSTPANGPLEYHTSGQCHMLATVEVDSLASYFSIFDVLLAAFPSRLHCLQSSFRSEALLRVLLV